MDFVKQNKLAVVSGAAIVGTAIYSSFLYSRIHTKRTTEDVVAGVAVAAAKQKGNVKDNMKGNVKSNVKANMKAKAEAGATKSPAEHVSVVCISGTFNPPHIAHVRMGIHAAKALTALGQKVACICFLPVHDNYLWNKFSMKMLDNPAKKPFCVPMAERVRLLKNILGSEDKKGFDCRVLDYEHQHGDRLEESPGYWAEKLPQGYLKTLSSATSLSTFASTWVKDNWGAAARCTLVQGADNLPYMPSWNNTAPLFAACDLVVVGRGSDSGGSASTHEAPESAASVTPQLVFKKDPTTFLKSFKTAVIRYPTAVSWDGKILFGASQGRQSISSSKHASATLFLIDPVPGLEDLSSTKVRNAVATLVKHGYTSPEMAAKLVSLRLEGKQLLAGIMKENARHFIKGGGAGQKVSL